MLFLLWDWYVSANANGVVCVGQRRPLFPNCQVWTGSSHSDSPRCCSDNARVCCCSMDVASVRRGRKRKMRFVSADDGNERAFKVFHKACWCPCVVVADVDVVSVACLACLFVVFLSMVACVCLPVNVLVVLFKW